MAVVRIPNGLSRMNCSRCGMEDSAWTGRRYIVVVLRNKDDKIK